MFTKKILAAAMMAALPLASMTLASPVQGQQYNREAPRGPVIRGFNVDEVRRLDPGVELNFDLYGSPGGSATIRIDGATRNLTLSETEPGQYEGSYTISSRDRIRPNSAVTANLREGNRVASQVLSESLLRGPGQRPGPGAMAPRVERFDVRGVGDLEAGDELTFTLMGTPGSKVEISIAGSRGVFFLPETRPGEYSGVYTVRRADRLAPNSAVTATIRNSGRATTTTLGRPLVSGPAPRPINPVARYCSNCATVETVNVIQVQGNAGYIGTVGGALVGGLLGSQIGSGNGRTAAQIAGVVGGAAVGRNIDNNNAAKAGPNQHYEVMVRYPNGATKVITYANEPGFRVGDKVRVDNNVLTRDQ
ncbi:glycine zipper 2TM domain-containing protein [Massilia sp. S19_KUP03_FR1]|uniref:glycine zipper 2TM domain-containing protein n=1 Tax=Massilia sp. S19_KUP03_FR1 TaxID=3025503 RepID=UPI002FCD1DE2